MAHTKIKTPQFGNTPVLTPQQAKIQFDQAIDLLTNTDNLQAPNFREIIRLFGRGISAKQELELAIAIFSYTNTGKKEPKKSDRNVDLDDVLWDFEKRPTKRLKNKKLKKYIDEWAAKPSGKRGSVSSFLEGLKSIQKNSLSTKDSSRSL